MTGKRVCPRHGHAHDADARCPYCEEPPAFEAHGLATPTPLMAGERCHHQWDELTGCCRQCRTVRADVHEEDEPTLDWPFHTVLWSPVQT